jgi:hypothetical protein
MPQLLALPDADPTAAAFEKMSIKMCPIPLPCLDGGKKPRAGLTSTSRQIRDFVLGKTDGAEPLRALFDHILDEPVPERLRALFQR